LIENVLKNVGVKVPGNTKNLI